MPSSPARGRRWMLAGLVAALFSGAPLPAGATPGPGAAEVESVTMLTTQRAAVIVRSPALARSVQVQVLIPARTDTGFRMLWTMIANALAAGAVALVRNRRRRTEILVWSSDDQATRVAGRTGAYRALTPTAPALYRTWLHSWLVRRDSTSHASRLARLQAHGKA